MEEEWLDDEAEGAGPGLCGDERAKDLRSDWRALDIYIYQLKVLLSLLSLSLPSYLVKSSTDARVRLAKNA